MSEEPTSEEAGSAEPMEGQSTAQAALPDAPKTSFVSGEDHVAEVNPSGEPSETKVSTDEVPTETSANVAEEAEIAQNLKPRVLSLKTNHTNR